MAITNEEEFYILGVNRRAEAVSWLHVEVFIVDCRLAALTSASFDTITVQMVGRSILRFHY